MRRGDVYDTRFDPIEGSEASGRRPAVVVSRNAFNAASPVVIVVPCTTYRQGRRVYPSQVRLAAGHGGLTADSLAQAEQVRAVSKARLVHQRGSLSDRELASVAAALAIVLDLA